MNNLNWLVACKVKPSKFEGKYEKIVAAFAYPTNAEEFIKLVLPEETREDFYIIRKGAIGA